MLMRPTEVLRRGSFQLGFEGCVHFQGAEVEEGVSLGREISTKE